MADDECPTATLKVTTIGMAVPGSAPTVAAPPTSPSGDFVSCIVALGNVNAGMTNCAGKCVIAEKKCDASGQCL